MNTSLRSLGIFALLTGLSSCTWDEESNRSHVKDHSFGLEGEDGEDAGDAGNPGDADGDSDGQSGDGGDDTADEGQDGGPPPPEGTPCPVPADFFDGDLPPAYQDHGSCTSSGVIFTEPETNQLFGTCNVEESTCDNGYSATTTANDINDPEGEEQNTGEINLQCSCSCERTIETPQPGQDPPCSRAGSGLNVP